MCCAVLEQSAAKSCRCYFQSHRSRDVSATIQDMGIKGFAYPADQCQTQNSNSVVEFVGQCAAVSLNLSGR